MNAGKIAELRALLQDIGASEGNDDGAVVDQWIMELHEQCTALLDEIERQAETITELHEGRDMTARAYRARGETIDRQAAEIERLRAALVAADEMRPAVLDATGALFADAELWEALNDPMIDTEGLRCAANHLADKLESYHKARKEAP